MGGKSSVSRPLGVAAKGKSQLQDDSIMGVCPPSEIKAFATVPIFQVQFTDLQQTNNSSIVSKRSVERLYYPTEPHYFRYFVKKPQRRSPLINRGYWLRMRAVDLVVRQFLEEASTKQKIVINLGCG